MNSPTALTDCLDAFIAASLAIQATGAGAVYSPDSN